MSIRGRAVLAGCGACWALGQALGASTTTLLSSLLGAAAAERRQRGFLSRATAFAGAALAVAGVGRIGGRGQRRPRLTPSG